MTLRHLTLLSACAGLAFLAGCDGGGSSGSSAASTSAPATSATTTAAPQQTVYPAPLIAPLGSATALEGPLAAPTSLPLGDFQVHWRPQGQDALVITHASAPREALFASAPGESFLVAAQGTQQVDGGQSAGFYSISDHTLWEAARQEVLAIESIRGGVELRGRLLGGPVPITYVLRLEELASNQVGFSVSTAGAPSNRVHLTWLSNAREHVFGFGEQFSQFDHKGLRVPILTREQGIGRGLQPLTGLLNQFTGAGGSSLHTYYAVPWAFSSERKGWLLENNEYSVFDMTDVGRTRVEVFSSELHGRLYRGDTLLDVLTELTTYTGRMPVIHYWAH